MIKRRDLLIGASALAALPAFPRPGKSAVRFIQITDTHFGQPGRQHGQIMHQLAAQISKLPMAIDFAVHTGDVMHDNILDESAVAKAKAALAEINLPIHYVAGNHDILRKQQTATTTAYEKHFGRLLDVHDYKGLALVTLYTEPLARSFEVPGFQPLEELDTALDLLKGKPVVVAHHIPSIGSFHNNSFHNGWPEQAAEKWSALLNKHGVSAVLAGHFHRGETFWLDKVPMHVAPAVSTSWERQPAYRIYTFENNHLSYRTQYLGD